MWSHRHERRSHGYLHRICCRPLAVCTGSFQIVQCSQSFRLDGAHFLARKDQFLWEESWRLSESRCDECTWSRVKPLFFGRRLLGFHDNMIEVWSYRHGDATWLSMQVQEALNGVGAFSRGLRPPLIQWRSSSFGHACWPGTNCN